MSDDSDFKDENEVPTVVLCVLVVLLVLLAAAIWVAFFSALRKAIKKFAEIKRYRRRQDNETNLQNVLAAIATRTMDDRRSAPNVFAAFPIGFDRALRGSYDIRNISVATLSVPPSYEEAIRQTAPAATAVSPLPSPPVSSTLRPIPLVERNRHEEPTTEQSLQV